MRDSPVGQSDSKDRGSFSCPHTWLEASVSVSLSWIFYPLKTFQGQSSAQLHNMLSHHIGKRDDTCYSWPSSCIYKFPHPLSWTVTLNGLRPIIDGVMDRNPATQPLLLRKCFSPHIWEMSGWVQCCQRFLASLKILCFHVVTFLWACQHIPMSSSSQLLLFQSSGAQTQKREKTDQTLRKQIKTDQIPRVLMKLLGSPPSCHPTSPNSWCTNHHIFYTAFFTCFWTFAYKWTWLFYLSRLSKTWRQALCVCVCVFHRCSKPIT